MKEMKKYQAIVKSSKQQNCVKLCYTAEEAKNWCDKIAKRWVKSCSDNQPRKVIDNQESQETLYYVSVWVISFNENGRIIYSRKYWTINNYESTMCAPCVD